jgi:hypothetical protein
MALVARPVSCLDSLPGSPVASAPALHRSSTKAASLSPLTDAAADPPWLAVPRRWPSLTPVSCLDSTDCLKVAGCTSTSTTPQHHRQRLFCHPVRCAYHRTCRANVDQLHLRHDAPVDLARRHGGMTLPRHGDWPGSLLNGGASQACQLPARPPLSCLPSLAQAGSGHRCTDARPLRPMAPLSRRWLRRLARLPTVPGNMLRRTRRRSPSSDGSITAVRRQLAPVPDPPAALVPVLTLYAHAWIKPRLLRRNRPLSGLNGPCPSSLSRARQPLGWDPLTWYVSTLPASVLPWLAGGASDPRVRFPTLSDAPDGSEAPSEDCIAPAGSRRRRSVPCAAS